MMALLVLMILGILSVQLAIQSLNRSSREKDSAEAFNLAESGADTAEAWLRAQSSPPVTDREIGPINLGNGSYHAWVIRDADNDGAWQKGYTIYSQGQVRGDRSKRLVIMKVQAESFALYSYFTDEERSSVTNGTIQFYARDRVYGPVHSNDRFHISWDSTSADPIFYGTVSSHNTSVDWSPRAPSSRNDWRRVLDGGQDALTLGADDIALPNSSDEQRNAAWGNTTGFPSSDGVYLPAVGTQVDAGIFVRGDSTVQFSVDNATGNQIVAITQSSKTTTLTINLASDQTTLRDKDGVYHYYSGIPNGVLYSTGNITSLKGTLANNYENGSSIVTRNAWTIATDVNGGKNITITDNLQYKTEPNDKQPATHPSNLRAATLGLVAQDVILSSSTPNNLTIDGVILAGGENTANGSFYNADWNGAKKNNLNVLGGIIQKKRGPVGTFNPSNNVQITGYNKNYKYDPRMVDSPPPFFPTTGQFDVKSWQYD
jgi:hypothetical protein